MSDKVQKVLTFKREKDTKNAVKFEEEGDVKFVGSLYVQKHTLLTLGNPQTSTVKVTIEIP